MADHMDIAPIDEKAGPSNAASPKQTFGTIEGDHSTATETQAQHGIQQHAVSPTFFGAIAGTGMSLQGLRREPMLNNLRWAAVPDSSQAHNGRIY